MKKSPRRRTARRFRLPSKSGCLRPAALDGVRLTHAERFRIAAAVVLGIGFHALVVMAFWRGASLPRAPQMRVTTDVELKREMRAVPPPSARLLPEPSAPPPGLKRRPRHVDGPPAAAAAGSVVASHADATEPPDVTGFEMPVGNKEQYAGGLTASTGTSKAAVEDLRATPQGVPAPMSLARPSAPARKAWACRWPEEEESSSVRDVRVRIAVHVGENGSATDVELLDSAAPSFARAARRCALGETYRAALDDRGRAVSGVTRPFVVHFVR